MATKTAKRISPKGTPAVEAAKRRARSEEYREARDEYAAIRELREKNWIAAHIRERRYELELTQEQVAERAGTSHSYISRLEKGDHMPTIDVLKRILGVLDEELLIGIEERTRDEEPERDSGVSTPPPTRSQTTPEGAAQDSCQSLACHRSMGVGSFNVLH